MLSHTISRAVAHFSVRYNAIVLMSAIVQDDANQSKLGTGQAVVGLVRRFGKVPGDDLAAVCEYPQGHVGDRSRSRSSIRAELGMSQPLTNGIRYRILGSGGQYCFVTSCRGMYWSSIVSASRHCPRSFGSSKRVEYGYNRKQLNFLVLTGLI